MKTAGELVTKILYCESDKESRQTPFRSRHSTHQIYSEDLVHFSTLFVLCLKYLVCLFVFSAAYLLYLLMFY